MKKKVMLLLVCSQMAVGSFQAQEVVRGLKLPQLTTGQRDQIQKQGDPSNSYAEGQFIYNLDSNCLEYWNGDEWVSMCGEVTPYVDPILPPKDETGQYRLNGKTCYDVTVTDFPIGECMPLESRINDFAGGFSFTYTFSGSAAYNITGYYAIGDGRNLVNLSRAGDIITATFVSNVKDLATDTTKTFTLIVTFDDVNNDPKYVSIDVSVQDCACGCSVKTVGGGWLTFMCYNLGADPTMTIEEQMAYTPSPNTLSSTDATVYGDLYQWGRRTDGHEKRTSGITTTTANTDTPAHGNFIYYQYGYNDWRSPQNSNLWQPSTRINNPCPAGYRIPTQAEWHSIISGGTTKLLTPGGTATGTSGNKFTWNSSGTGGYKISPDNGTTTTLFLPAAGYRFIVIDYAGWQGHYWSSTVLGTANSYYLYFDIVDPGLSTCNVCTESNSRGFGRSVRCVAYQ